MKYIDGTMAKTRLDKWEGRNWGSGDDYDWEEAFKFASASCSSIPGHECDTGPFDLNSVDDVIASVFGQNDEESWLALVKLKDGRFCFVSAACDYTGWDCQAGGASTVCMDLGTLKRLGMDSFERKRLGL